MHRNGGLEVLLLDALIDVGVDEVGGNGGGGLTALATRLTGLVGSGHAGVQRGQVAHHTLVLLLLVGMDGLGMLAKVVETRKLLAALTCKRALAGVFPGWSRPS